MAVPALVSLGKVPLSWPRISFVPVCFLKARESTVFLPSLRFMLHCLHFQLWLGASGVSVWFAFLLRVGFLLTESLDARSHPKRA